MTLISYAGQKPRRRRVYPEPPRAGVVPHPRPGQPCWVADAQRLLTSIRIGQYSTRHEIEAVAIHVCRTVPEVMAACFNPDGTRIKRLRHRKAS